MSMAWDHAQPAPKALWAQVRGSFPMARNLGIFNRRNIAGSSKASLHSEGRALDIGLNAFDRGEKVIGDRLFAILCESSTTLQLEEVIWNQQIWSLRRPIVHPYAGRSPHHDHLHVAFTRPGSQVADLPITFAFRLAQLRTGFDDLGSVGRSVG
jgi:hypothetical protein